MRMSEGVVRPLGIRSRYRSVKDEVRRLRNYVRSGIAHTIPMEYNVSQLLKDEVTERIPAS